MAVRLLQYLDFVALADHMGNESVALALQSFDRLYLQTSGESPLQQLQVQLANPVPYDLEETELSEYKNLHPRWHDWNTVQAACSHIATVILIGCAIWKMADPTSQIEGCDEPDSDFIASCKQDQ